MVSAVLLVAIGGIHLFLVFAGVGGFLGVMFVLNGLAGIALAIGIVVLRGRLLVLATILGLGFALASLIALVVTLTVGLFGITVSWDFTLVPETVIVDAIGVVVLAVTTAFVLRRREDA